VAAAGEDDQDHAVAPVSGHIQRAHSQTTRSSGYQPCCIAHM